MKSIQRNDPILERATIELEKLYGDSLRRIVLYGSRARGDAHMDSDYDLAVFIKHLDDRWREIYRLSDLEFDLMRETGKNVHALPFQEDAYMTRTPLMHEIRREGIDIYGR